LLQPVFFNHNKENVLHGLSNCKDRTLFFFPNRIRFCLLQMFSLTISSERKVPMSFLHLRHKKEQLKETHCQTRLEQRAPIQLADGKQV